MNETIKEILMRRDEMSAEDADELITAAKEVLNEYLNAGNLSSAEDICNEFFGLEPDYIEELL